MTFLKKFFTASGEGRFSLDKQFQGDFTGTGQGEMLTAVGAVQGSAVYVAIERVSGTLHGRRAAFALHHTGIMNRGAQQLSVIIVPDSGTDQLERIAGTMTITITDGKHFYDLDCTLPGA
ncbi:MAG: DUF3224 domain-containing protein [Gemmatimonadaceae bacterium]